MTDLETPSGNGNFVTESENPETTLWLAENSAESLARSADDLRVMLAEAKERGVIIDTSAFSDFFTKNEHVLQSLVNDFNGLKTDLLGQGIKMNDADMASRRLTLASEASSKFEA